MGRPLSHSGVGDVTYPTSCRGVAPIKGRLTFYSDGRYAADGGLYDSDDVRMSSTFPACAEGNDWEDPTCLDVEASFIPSTQRRPTYAVESTDSRPTRLRPRDIATTLISTWLILSVRNSCQEGLLWDG